MRLKARPARIRNQCVQFLANWLEQCEIDPAEPCRGSSAVQVLFGRLFTEHGNTSISLHGESLIVGTDTLITPDAAREYIWGESTEIVTVDDEELDEDEGEADTEPALETEEEDNASSR